MLNYFKMEWSGQRLVLSGELDSVAASRLAAELASLDGQNLTLDLTDITFIDSGGIRELLEQRRRHSGLRVGSVSDQVRRVLDVVGVTELLLDG